MKRMMMGAGVFLCLTVSSAAQAVFQPVNLRVEYQTAPLGIDTARPRFSWEVLCAERSCRQSAYQIRVGRNAEELERGENLIWNSGWIESAQSVAVVYGGSPLESRRRYFWRVQLWDESGRAGEESETASFQTALLQPEEAAGAWLWEDEAVEPNDYAFFRTGVELPGQPFAASALVSAHNHFLFFVNGRQVSGFVSPSPSRPDKTKYYIVYDITPWLQPGENVLAAAVHYKGVDGQSYIKAVPGFYCEAWLSLPDGSERMIVSGPDWKVLPQTPWDEKAPFLSLRQHTAAEYYDARLVPSGWTEPGFDDSSWRPAAVVLPDFRLRSQYVPESRVMETWEPTLIRHPWPGVWVFDFGREFSGWVRLDAEGPEGKKVKIRYSDRLFAGRPAWSVANEPTATYFDRYIFAGGGVESWAPAFGYRGFRFVEVTGFPGKLESAHLRGEFVRTALPLRAEFKCSNELLNRIYEISVHTQALGMAGQLVDCVHREQSQWHADAEMQSGTVFYNFFDPHLVRQALLALKDGQEDDGRLPANYPSQPPWVYYIPEWDLSYVPMLWRTWYYYADRYILEECWPAVKKLIGFFESQQDSTGLVVKSKAWHINDWPEDYAKMDNKGRYLTVENCLYYHTLTLAAEIAALLGHSEEASLWRTHAEKLKAAINKWLYDKEAHAYRDCSNSTKKHAGASVLALEFGIVPEGEVEAVLAHVKRQGLGTSTYLTYHLFEMLYLRDEGAFAYELLNRESWPGWGYMLRQGHGTTWEGWNDLASRAHPFNAHPARFLISGIVGISPGAPGWETIVVRPNVDGDLEWAEAKIPTVRGEVTARWEKRRDSLILQTQIPGNTQARIFLPLRGAASPRLYESGRLIWDGIASLPEAALASVKVVGRSGDYVEAAVGAGRWEFQVETR